MSKPFHSGKAAFNGLMGAKLAKNGFVARRDMFALNGGFVQALVQDKVSGLTPVNFDHWEILKIVLSPMPHAILHIQPLIVPKKCWYPYR